MTALTPPVLPQAPEAEEALLGALLAAGALGAERSLETAHRIAAAGLEPAHFYGGANSKHARIFRACLELVRRGEPTEALLVIAELERHGWLEDVGGREYVQAIAALAPTTTNAAHYAGLIVEAAQARHALALAQKIAETAANGYDRARVAELAARLQEEHAAGGGRFPGLSHAEALARKVPPTRQLVEGLVEAGSLGTIAGLPETHKSFLALAVALRVATGGRVLGRKVLQTGPTAYWWQDDSETNELGRIHEYARRHDLTGELPVRWHLNEGLRLPDDIGALRAEIEREGQVLVVLDSLYNFLGGVRLKDEDVATVLDALKRDVCDPTGCTVAIVDHAPWPTEDNRGQRRAYGSVFKTAAIRWSIFLERDGDTLHAQASGNNLAGGLPRTPVLWNADRLELEPVSPPTRTSELADAIAAFLRKNPGATTTFVRAGVKGTDAAIDAVLASDPRFHTVPPALFGKPRNATCWALAEQVPSLLRATSAENAADVTPTFQPVAGDNVGANHPQEGEAFLGSPPTLGANLGGSAADDGERREPR